eukprot:CAMPEP_0194763222 /NCGR_PEP_ID=MMETSP0323_2-20130528/18560_1 /TAXON_ID=2866 ORGANISM="Crypthecodinium cohnii, Strain Seligo" /NCGR_SAMPLE_ID=MMETSP0323_2 /ASSEMBLY_ACC=CAM_ASM_000346 /LENGTH=34 /DNA_ID= /DNA_START= /DNA_END= /DNA_ORIENTATION=
METIGLASSSAIVTCALFDASSLHGWLHAIAQAD